MDIHPNDPYGQRLLTWLNGYGNDLWNNLHRVPGLSASASAEIIAEFVKLACQCQNEGNIVLGRCGIWSLPKDWTVERIKHIAASMLDLNDEWEYRRLLEVYERLDKGLLTQLIDRGLQSKCDEVREAAQDFQQLT